MIKINTFNMVKLIAYFFSKLIYVFFFSYFFIWSILGPRKKCILPANIFEDFFSFNPWTLFIMKI